MIEADSFDVEQELYIPKPPKTAQEFIQPYRSTGEVVTDHVKAWQAGILYFSAGVIWLLPLIGCGASTKYGQPDCLVQPNIEVSISSLMRQGSFATSFAYFGALFFSSVFFILTQFEKSFFITLTTLFALVCSSIPLLVPISTDDTTVSTTEDNVHLAFAILGGIFFLFPFAYILVRLYRVARTTQPQASMFFWLLLCWISVYLIAGLIIVGVNGSQPSGGMGAYGVAIGEYLAFAALVCATRVVIRARKIFEIKKV
jgi:hypothetical protein